MICLSFSVHGKNQVIICGKINFMAIEKILKELTPVKIENEINKVKNSNPSDEVVSWVKKYEKVGKRNPFIWNWLWEIFQIMKMPFNPINKHEKELLEVKVLITMFIVVLDDVADKGEDQLLLKELFKIPFDRDAIKKEHLNKEKKDFLFFATSLWDQIINKIERFPKYEEYKDIFEYDFLQTINAMRYSHLLSRNMFLINLTESWTFSSYNMNIFVYSDLDLMCSKNINIKEVGELRPLIYEVQKMTRIGNWISTWEREVRENDFANGIIAKAVEDNIVSIEEIKDKKNGDLIIRKIKDSKIEECFLQEWEDIYNKIKDIGKDINKQELTNLVLNALEETMTFHLSSKGYK